MGRQARAMPPQLLIRATPAAQATLAQTATGHPRVRATVDQTATGQVARVRTRDTVDQEARVRAMVDQTGLVQTGVDLRQTRPMARTPLLLEVALVLSMVLGPLAPTEVALRLTSQLVLWARVPTVIRQQALVYYAVKVAETKTVVPFIVPAL